MPLCADCTRPSPLFTARPARQPTAASTACPWLLTTTSVTMLAKKQRRSVVLPAQSPVGRLTLTKDDPALSERKRPLLVAAKTVLPLESAGSKAMRKVRIPSGAPPPFFHDRPPFVLREMPRPASEEPPKALSPVPASSTRRGVE